MLTGRTIVCLSSIDWDFLWQAHQQVMASLAAAGNRVLFVESTGVRAPTLRDLPRLWRRLKGGGRGHGRRRPPDAVSVYSPVLLPFPYAAWARAVNLPLLERAVRQRIGAPGEFASSRAIAAERSRELCSRRRGVCDLPCPSRFGAGPQLRGPFGAVGRRPGTLRGRGPYGAAP